MSHAEKQKAMAIGWACQTLKDRGVEFKAALDGGEAWDILLPTGWVGVNGWKELVQQVKDIVAPVAPMASKERLKR